MYLHEKKMKAASEGIILQESETERHRYITHVKQMMLQHDWDHFLTLTFKYPVYDEKKVSQAVNRFINKLSERAYGDRSRKRVVAFPIIEKHVDDSFHVHVMIQDPFSRILKPERKKSFRLRDAVITAWLQASSSSGNLALSSSGDEWIKPIDDVRETVQYMLKRYRPKSESSTVILWEEASLSGRKAV